MGMSMHVIGLVEPSEKFKQMYAIYEACELADVSLPDEVDKFFMGEEPDGKGMKVDLPKTEYEDDMKNGFEIRIADIPDNVTVLRFYNSY